MHQGEKFSLPPPLSCASFLFAGIFSQRKVHTSVQNGILLHFEMAQLALAPSGLCRFVLLCARPQAEMDEERKRSPLDVLLPVVAPLPIPPSASGAHQPATRQLLFPCLSSQLSLTLPPLKLVIRGSLRGRELPVPRGAHNSHSALSGLLVPSASWGSEFHKRIPPCNA